MWTPTTTVGTTSAMTYQSSQWNDSDGDGLRTFSGFQGDACPSTFEVDR